MEQPRGQDPIQPLYIPSTPYATSYASSYTVPGSGLLTAKEIELLHHVNCSYLSSGRPPTLLALKQHAHSIANLIRKLAPSVRSSGVGDLAIDEDDYGFLSNDAFDWLNNLDKPYENDDDSHHVPLWAIANIVMSESEVDKNPEHRCPLTEVKDPGPLADEGELRRPYSTHHSLVMHANECLEILDHEYSSTGGLMSLLPPGTEHDTEQLAAARNCLLGQWLLHHQHLVARMHELEINYANALDALAGEAIVPLQIIRRAGPDGVTKGREVGYPQDRYVLVNAGDDVTSHIHRLLDRAEAQVGQKEKIWKSAGVSGERMWHKSRGGNWYARGIIPVDLLTRYYRIAGKGHASPLFVLPDIEQHPGVAHTRRIEERPTVVSVVTPTWPERVSEWEKKYRAKIEHAEQVEKDNDRLMREMVEMMDTMAAKDEELRRVNDELTELERNQPETDS